MSELGGYVQRTLLAYVVAAVLLIGGLSWATGRYFPSETGALREAVRIADTVEVVKWDTVKLYQRRVDTVRQVSDSLDRLVTVRDGTTVVIRDTVRDVPPEVIADLQANRLTVATQDTLIRSLYAHDTTQQWRIATRDKLIAQLSRRKFPLGLSLVAGPMCTQSGCALGVGLGLSYRIR